MTSLYDIRTKIKEIIQNNVTDLNISRRRDGRDWVHTDFPRFDSEKPRIGIVTVSAPSPALAVNTTQRRQEADFQISILVDTNNKFINPDTNRYMNADETLEWFSEKLFPLLNANSDIIALDKVHWCVIDDEGGIKPQPTQKIYQKNLNLRVELRRG